MSGVCEHGSLARQCLVCELTADLAAARRALRECAEFIPLEGLWSVRRVLSGVGSVDAAAEWESALEKAGR